MFDILVCVIGPEMKGIKISPVLRAKLLVFIGEKMRSVGEVFLTLLIFSQIIQILKSTLLHPPLFDICNDCIDCSIRSLTSIPNGLL